MVPRKQSLQDMVKVGSVALLASKSRQVRRSCSHKWLAYVCETCSFKLLFVVVSGTLLGHSYPVAMIRQRSRQNTLRKSRLHTKSSSTSHVL